VFAALANPTRRAIVERLAEGDATISEVAAPLDMSLAALSRHVRVLTNAGLVARDKRGRDHHLRLVREPLVEAITWMVHYGAFWEQQLDSLEAMFGRPQGTAGP
jgi:DNA-binding transcriptional ArsR family regulator